MDTQVEAPKEIGLNRKTTLNEWGNKLPIFDHIQGKNIEFTFRSWDMEMEEKLSELQAKCKNTGEFVRSMIAMLLDMYNGQDFQTYDEVTKTATLAKLPFPDMMYMYIYLRVEELGDEVVMNLSCPACKKLIEDFHADLKTLRVEVKDKEHPPTITYDLKSPIVMSNGSVVTQIKLGVSKWTALESLPAEKASNQGAVKQSLFVSSFESFLKDGEAIKGFVDPKELIKKLKKFDIEKISKLLTENNGGPSMAVGGECPHCKSKFVKPLDWGYETFFDSSSL